MHFSDLEYRFIHNSSEIKRNRNFCPAYCNKFALTRHNCTSPSVFLTGVQMLLVLKVYKCDVSLHNQ